MSRDFNQDGEFFDVAQDPEVLEGLLEITSLLTGHYSLDIKNPFPYLQSTQKKVLSAPGNAWRILLVETLI